MNTVLAQKYIDFTNDLKASYNKQVIKDLWRLIKQGEFDQVSNIKKIYAQDLSESLSAKSPFSSLKIENILKSKVVNSGSLLTWKIIYFLAK